MAAQVGIIVEAHRVGNSAGGFDRRLEHPAVEVALAKLAAALGGEQEVMATETSGREVGAELVHEEAGE